MTETEMKLQDAEAQLRLALHHTGDEGTVRSCINSLISAARSVTFVMQRESSDSPELADWYKTRIAELDKTRVGPILRFFSDCRTYSIHKGVILPNKVTATITALTINGVPQVTKNPSMTFYRFDGIDKYLPNDSGGVYRLCEQYLATLRALVADWIRKREGIGIR